MPDHLKDTLLSRWNGGPEQQLNIEKALMRLSGAFPEALSVRVKPDSDLASRGGIGGWGPFRPKTIRYDPTILGAGVGGISNSGGRNDLLDGTLAHELMHVRQLGDLPWYKRIYSVATGADALDDDAERSALEYISRLKGDIQLK